MSWHLLDLVKYCSILVLVIYLRNLKYVSYFISCRPFKAMYAIYSQMACCNANCCNSDNLPLFMTLCCRRKTYFANCLFHTVAKFSFYEGNYLVLVWRWHYYQTSSIIKLLAILAAVFILSLGNHWSLGCPPSLELVLPWDVWEKAMLEWCAVWAILSFRDSHFWHDLC